MTATGAVRRRESRASREADRPGALRRKLDRDADRSGGPLACWPWMGTRVDGYGRLYLGSEELLAHKVALELELGRDLAPHEKAMHSCDNRPCCNPRHLSPGTTAENNADCIRKGRHSHGERHPTAKLTAAQVDEIRAELARGYRYGMYRELERRYGVTSRQIAYIHKGESWSSPAAVSP